MSMTGSQETTTDRESALAKSIVFSRFPRALRPRKRAWLAVLAASLASPVFAQNFHDLVNRENCDSVIGTLRAECVSINSTKDKACAVGGQCDFDKHVAQIAEYKAAIVQLASGAVAESGVDVLKEKIARMKGELDDRREEAEDTEKAARECADARQAVYDFFDDDVIPDTERVAREAIDRRKELLKVLEDAGIRQRDAKDKRDGLAGADPERDRDRWEAYVKARDEYDASSEAYRKAEASLAEFNLDHGADIDDALRKLVDYYKSKQVGHKNAIEEQKNRSELCGKLEYLSY
jgi:hypothetical protein